MSFLRAIFFDIGDTLVFDLPPLHERLRIALQECGVKFDDTCFMAAYRVGEEYALSQYLLGKPWENADVLCESAKIIFRALSLSAPSEQMWKQIFLTFASVPFIRQPHPAASMLLEALKKKGFVLGVISDWDSTLPDLLAQWGLACCFDAVAVSSLTGFTKPDPRLFAEALRLVNVAPEQSLHIGDWEALDIAGARSAGMQTLLFDHARRSPDGKCPRVQTFEQLTEYLL